MIARTACGADQVTTCPAVQLGFGDRAHGTRHHGPRYQALRRLGVARRICARIACQIRRATSASSGRFAEGNLPEEAPLLRAPRAQQAEPPPSRNRRVRRYGVRRVACGLWHRRSAGSCAGRGGESCVRATAACSLRVCAWEVAACGDTSCTESRAACGTVVARVAVQGAAVEGRAYGRSVWRYVMHRVACGLWHRCGAGSGVRRGGGGPCMLSQRVVSGCAHGRSQRAVAVCGDTACTESRAACGECTDVGGARWGVAGDRAPPADACELSGGCCSGRLPVGLSVQWGSAASCSGTELPWKYSTISGACSWSSRVSCRSTRWRSRW